MWPRRAARILDQPPAPRSPTGCSRAAGACRSGFELGDRFWGLAFPNSNPLSGLRRAPWRTRTLANAWRSANLADPGRRRATSRGTRWPVPSACVAVDVCSIRASSIVSAGRPIRCVRAPVDRGARCGATRAHVARNVASPQLCLRPVRHHRPGSRVVRRSRLRPGRSVRRRSRHPPIVPHLRRLEGAVASHQRFRVFFAAVVAGLRGPARPPASTRERRASPRRRRARGPIQPGLLAGWTSSASTWARRTSR